MIKSLNLYKTRNLRLACVLLSSVALPILPANADAELEALQARLEKAQKENLKLKTEKVEKENLIMKAETIENENAALRNEKIDKTPTASIPAPKVAQAAPPEQLVKVVARREVAEPAPVVREQAIAHKEINRAIDGILKDDTRREMTAVQKPSIAPELINEKPWQGVYAGINAGYGEGQANYVGNTAGPVEIYPGPGAAILYPHIYNSYPSFYSYDGVINLSGPVAGGQLGYNHQFKNKIVAGIETDFDYVDINNRYSIGGANSVSQVNKSQVNNTNYNDRTGINWMGTLRLRLGYDLGKFLPYITGGFAYGSVSNNSLGLQQFIYANNSGGQSVSFGNATTNSSGLTTGWVVGAGAEYIVADNWSVKGEYLFTQLGNLNISGYPAAMSTMNTPALAGTSVLNGVIGPWNTHQARVGLNYHTGWLGGANAVTVKY